MRRKEVSWLMLDKPLAIGTTCKSAWELAADQDKLVRDDEWRWAMSALMSVCRREGQLWCAPAACTTGVVGVCTVLAAVLDAIA